MGNFNFEIPEELHKNFKSKCALKGIDMRDKIVELIKEDIKNKES